MFYFSTDLLISALIFVTTLVISFYPLKRIIGQRAPAAIASIAIALIAVYFLSYSQFSLIKDIYTFGGVIFILLIPTVIAFFFIYTSSINGVFRKAFWIFYGILSVYLMANANNPQGPIITITAIVILVIIILDNKIKSIFNAKKNLKFHN